MINIPIPNMLNGVSQQAPAVRQPSQGEIQENAYSSAIESLSKRPPTEHIARLAGTDDLMHQVGDGGVKTHVIDRGDGVESYMVVLRKPSSTSDTGCIQVRDLKQGGVSRTVSIPAGQSQTDVLNYLMSGNATDAWKDLSLTTIGDYTFIANKAKTVTMSSDTMASRNPEALFWVKTGNVATRYSISAETTDGVKTSTHTTGSSGQHTGTVDGTTFSSVSHGDTVLIAAELRAGMTAPADTSWSRKGYAIHVIRTTNSSSPGVLKVSTEDGLGGNGVLVVSKEVEAIEDLPIIAKDGMVVKIIGTPEEDFDDYYVKFKATDGSFSEGVWEETVAPGIKYRLDPAAMPLVLIRYFDANGTPKFVLKTVNGTSFTDGSAVPGSDASWGSRSVGDVNTNPDPSFVGQGIDDVFLYKNRLGFLAGENVILSEAGDYFNFFRVTTSTLLDTDPIDLASSAPHATQFRSAVPLQERLFLFSDKSQHVLFSQDGLTPKTASMTLVSSYECQAFPEPAAVGQEIYFPFTRGGSYTGVRAMLINSMDAEQVSSPDVSGHVNQYILGRTVKIQGSPHDNVLTLLTDADRSSLYVYKWFDTNSERIQASWSKWTFGSEAIVSFDWLDSALYLVIRRQDCLSLERITVEPNRRDAGSEYLTLLDRRFVATPVASGANAVFTVPYGAYYQIGSIPTYQVKTGTSSVASSNFISSTVTLPVLGSVVLGSASGNDLTSPDYGGNLETVISVILPPWASIAVTTTATAEAAAGNPAIFTSSTAQPNFKVTLNNYETYPTWTQGSPTTTWSYRLQYDPLNPDANLFAVGPSFVRVQADLSVASPASSGGWSGNILVQNMSGVSADIVLKVRYVRALAGGIAATDPVYDHSCSMTGLSGTVASGQAFQPWTTAGWTNAGLPLGTVVNSSGVPYTVSSIGTPAGDGSVQVTLLPHPTIGSAAGKVVYWGYPYTMKYQFSTPYLKGEQAAPITSGRYQLHNMRVVYDRSRGFQVRVFDKYGVSDVTYDLQPTLHGVLVGEQLYTGSMPVPIRAKSDAVQVQLLNSSVFPSRFVSAEYEASYSTRYGRGNA